MKMLKFALFSTAILSSTAFAVSIPSEIYKPVGATVVKADRQGNGEFEAEFRVKGNDARSLARKVISHAKSKGFHLVESDIEHDDVDLKFERGDHELDVQIEVKNHGRIEYKADLDLNR